MSNTLLDTPTTPNTSNSHGNPHGIPDKFWDGEKNEIRGEALAKSYMELERRLSQNKGQNGSQNDVHSNLTSAEEYKIELKTDAFMADPEVNQQLFNAGFTQQQAQLVYDLASDHLIPMVSEMAEQFEAKHQLNSLKQHFGGDEKWKEISGQIRNWGRSAFPENVYHALSSSYEGVVAMSHMMGNSGEPGMLGTSMPASGATSEAGLKEMMRSPKYWRDHDPALMRQVKQGFAKLYPKKG